MTFAVGDRVVVNERYRGAGCNHGAIGYYGHVVGLDPQGDGFQPVIQVAFRGHINGLTPANDYYIQFDDTRPFPLYPFELDHAD